MNIIKNAIIVTAMLTSSIAAASDPLRVGLMLPSSGTYARLGNSIKNGFKLYINEHKSNLSGRHIEIIELDDASDPSKATDNMKKLINRDKVDVVVGTVHSGVAMAMAKIAKETGTMLIVPNAGAAAITGPMCAPNIYRSSFTMWQPGYAMGEAVAKYGHKKVVTITWKYGAGKESVQGFKDSFEKAGGKVVKDLEVPFPSVEFQALLTEIAAIKPDAVYTFFAGGGAVKFVKDYTAAGLKDKIPLYGSGFLTDGTLKAQGGDGEGLITALHYADGIDSDTDRSFRKGFAALYDGSVPDVYAVQGYDAAQILGIGLAAVKGDISKMDEMSDAIEATIIDSPRGKFKLSRSHNPIQDIYLRKAIGNNNKVIGLASKALADPARGCRR